MMTATSTAAARVVVAATVATTESSTIIIPDGKQHHHHQQNNEVVLAMDMTTSNNGGFVSGGNNNVTNGGGVGHLIRNRGATGSSMSSTKATVLPHIFTVMPSSSSSSSSSAIVGGHEQKSSVSSTTTSLPPNYTNLHPNGSNGTVRTNGYNNSNNNSNRNNSNTTGGKYYTNHRYITSPTNNNATSPTTTRISISSPTTGTSSSSSSPCNHFLLGGTYYPGKDKKQRTLLRRKTTLWYRILFSSPSRFTMIIVVGMTYLIGYYILVPTIMACFYYIQDGYYSTSSSSSDYSSSLQYYRQRERKRQQRKHHTDPYWLLNDPTLRNIYDSYGLPMNNQQQGKQQVKPSNNYQQPYLVAEKIAIEREQIRKSTGNEYRMKLLESISPDWYHRNDMNTNNDNNIDNNNKGKNNWNRQEQQQEANNDEQKPPQQNHHAPVSHYDTVEINFTPAVATDETPSTVKDRTASITNPLSSIRTIHNSNTFRSNSNCPKTKTIAIDKYRQSKIRISSSLSSLSSSSSSSLSSSSSTSTTVSDSSSMIQTTLIVQTSYDRLWILSETCSRWKDPIVAVLALQPDEQNDPDILLPLSGWKTACPHLNLIVYNIKGDTSGRGGVSGVVEEQQEEPQKLQDYPVNILRNLALDAADTSHVLVIDIDFVPSYNLHEMIRTALQARYVLHRTNQQLQKKQYRLQQGDTSNKTKSNLSNENDNTNWRKEVIVIPAFEKILDPPCTSEYDCKHHLRHDSNFIPKNFTALEHCYYTTNDCTVFQSKINPDGHSSTRTERWFDEIRQQNEQQQQQKQKQQRKGEDNHTPIIDGGVEFRKIDCFDTLRYEPYVVLPWCPMMMTELDDEDNDDHDSNNATNTNTTSGSKQLGQSENKYLPVSPYYDERFHGYGKNKIQHISHLRIAGYEFLVLPYGGFIVHNPHLESSIKHEWEDIQHSTLHKTMDKLYETFLMELTEYYSSTALSSSLTENNNNSNGLIARAGSGHRIIRQCERKMKIKKKKNRTKKNIIIGIDKNK